MSPASAVLMSPRQADMNADLNNLNKLKSLEANASEAMDGSGNHPWHAASGLIYGQHS